MAHDIVSSCGGNAALFLVHGIGHNEPFYKPNLSYWGPIIILAWQIVWAPHPNMTVRDAAKAGKVYTHFCEL